MRVSRHNGRSGAHGSYNPKHNDREFELEKAEELKREYTRNNLYWNCVDREIIRHEELNDNSTSFTDAEKSFYDLAYKDYVDGQNERNIKAGHRERCRTAEDLRTNDKTCPEETIYQIGDMNMHVDPDVLASITTEFFDEIQRRYGEHVHTLDWALHLDESTPHIHERHVFDVTNRYGERQPKQEQALRELGFELPDPSKKEGKYNNRKMSYDAECRKLLMDICKEHGLMIEEEPIYGGKKYLEKQEFIAGQISEKLDDLRNENSKLLVDNSVLIEQKAALECDIGKLDDERTKKELELDDVESFISDITAVAYHKACEDMIDDVTENVRKESVKEITKLKNEINSSTDLKIKVLGGFAVEQLTKLQQRFSGIKARVVESVKRTFSSEAKRNQLLRKIENELRPSIIEDLKRKKEAIKNKKERSIELPSRKRSREQCR